MESKPSIAAVILFFFMSSFLMELTFKLLAGVEVKFEAWKKT
jgi:hypothetical protein